jgi:flavin reductase
MMDMMDIEWDTRHIKIGNRPPDRPPAADSADFRLGMRRLPAGVSLITTRDGDTPYGLVATSVSSLSADPPTLLVCVNKSASSHDPLLRAGIFCVNVLANENEPEAARFASSGNRESRFAEGGWISLVTGAPVFEGALAAFDCVTAHAISYQSHTIFIGEIKTIHLPERQIEPLVYLDGRYRNLV